VTSGKEDRQPFTLVNAVALAAAVACIAAAVMSYRAHLTSREFGEKYERKLDLMKHDIDRLKRGFSCDAGGGVP